MSHVRIAMIIALGALGLPAAAVAQVPCAVAKIVPDNGVAGEAFGSALALDPGPPVRLVVGAPGDQLTTNTGAAYVFRLENGTWVQEAKLVPNDAIAGSDYGASVAIASGIILVGAPLHSEPPRSGKVYKFTLGAGQWQFTSELVAPNPSGLPDPDHRFGTAVALAGDGISLLTDLCGAPGADDSGLSSGAVYSNSWPISSPLGLSAGDEFGTALAGTGMILGHLAVGAPGDDNANGADAGAVYLYEGTPSPIGWGLVATLIAPGLGSNARLGESVALDGWALAWVVAGAPGAQRVAVFEAGNGNHVVNLVASQSALGFSFGSAVGVWADRIVAGDYSTTHNGPFTGAVYVFDVDQIGFWVQTAELVASDAAAGDGFGYAVDIKGDIIAVGAPGDDNANGNDAGAVYIYASGGTDCNNNGQPDLCDIADGTSQDCNGNGVPDECDIANGTSQDNNNNGIPDECEPCPGDLNGDGVVDLVDMSILLNNFGNTGPNLPGDIDGDGDVDLVDLSLLLSNFGTNC